MKNGMAVLEEYLQEEYVKFFEDADAYSNKMELLSSKYYEVYDKELCLKDGDKNYIMNISDGSIYKHYLIHKSNLPKDIRDGLIGGNTEEYENYINLIDVYGVTEDLKVYYCNEIGSTIVGTSNYDTLDPDTKLVQTNSNLELQKAINKTLGYDENNDLKIIDSSKLTDLDIDCTKYAITSLAGLSEFPVLKRLTIRNGNLSSLNGIQGCKNLEKLYLKDMILGDYTNIRKLKKLTTIYICLTNLINELNANDQIEKFSSALKADTDLPVLENLGICGTNEYFEALDSWGRGHETGYGDYWKYCKYESGNLSDVASLSEIHDSVRSNLKKILLCNNAIKNIDSLSYFLSLVKAYTRQNSQLANLDGLENHKQLKYICADRCKLLSSVEGVEGCSSLERLDIYGASSLTSLKGLEDCNNLVTLVAAECDIQDISALKDKTSLTYLSLYSNINLINVLVLGTCTSIDNLYLANNINMAPLQVRDALADEVTHILENCGINYSIPNLYTKYFSKAPTIDYANNKTLTDYSEEITLLLRNTNVKFLRLSNNSSLASSKLYQLKKDSIINNNDLDLMLTNLSRLTELQKELVRNVKNTDIEEITDALIDGEANSDIFLRYVLSTCVNLESCCLRQLGNLTEIDFIGDGKVKGLREIDIRQTNSALTDVSALTELNAKTFLLFAFSNPNVNVGDLSTVLNDYSYYGQYNQSFNATDNTDIRGFAFEGDLSLIDMSNYSGDGIRVACGTWATGTLDLTVCPNLKSVATTCYNGIIKVGGRLETVGHCRNMTLDLTECESIDLLQIDTVSTAAGEKVVATLRSIPGTCSIHTLTFKRLTSSNLEFLNSSDINLSNVQVLKIEGVSPTSQPMKVYNLSGLTKFSNLEELYLSGGNNLDDISAVSNLTNKTKLIKLSIEKCPKLEGLPSLTGFSNLTTIIVNSTSVSNVSSLGDVTSLTSLDLANNNISDISFVSNLINLTGLNLNQNNIVDLSSLSTLVDSCENNTVLFSVLWLKSNPELKNTADNGYNNIACLKKVYDAGCKTIHIESCKFSIKNNEFSGYSGIKY